MQLTRFPAAAFLVAVLAASPARAQSSSAPRSVVAALTRLENAWAAAVIQRDSAAIARIVAPRWIYSDESGTMNRDQGIEAFTRGADTVVTAGNEGMHFEVYRDVAIVTGILWMKGHGAEGEFDRRYRYTDTWLKTPKGWQCIASQDYLIPGAAK